MTQALRFGFNRQRSETTQSVRVQIRTSPGNAGLLGASADPFDWGAPNLSFSTFTSLRDMSPRCGPIGRSSIGDTITKIRGKQHAALRRRLSRHSRRQPHRRERARQLRLHRPLHRQRLRRLSARPAAAGDACSSVPDSSSSDRTRGICSSRTTGARTDKLTVNAGLALRVLLAAVGGEQPARDARRRPGFTAAVPVDRRRHRSVFRRAARHDRPVRSAPASRRASASPGGRSRAPSCAPATASTTTRASISTSRSSSPASRRSPSPTRCSRTARRPLPIETALPPRRRARRRTPTRVDPNYRLGYVQIWNLDVQRDLTRTVQLGVGYTGTKGSNLDILRAPNRGPDGPADCRRAAVHLGIVRGADSIMQCADAPPAPAADRRHRRWAAPTRCRSRSTMPRRSAGGGGVGRAERSGSGGRARPLELRSAPPLRRRLHLRAAVRREQALVQQRRRRGRVLGNWQINGNGDAGVRHAVHRAGARQHSATSAAASTARCAPNYNGQPIAISDPTSLLFFNTAAFSVPAPGTFGNAGRNTIIGPGTSVLNLGPDQEHDVRPDARPVDPAAGQQRVQHRAVRVDRHDRQLADIRSGHGGAPDAPRAAR